MGKKITSRPPKDVYKNDDILKQQSIQSKGQTFDNRALINLNDQKWDKILQNKLPDTLAGDSNQIEQNIIQPQARMDTQDRQNPFTNRQNLDMIQSSQQIFKMAKFDCLKKNSNVPKKILKDFILNFDKYLKAIQREYPSSIIKQIKKFLTIQKNQYYLINEYGQKKLNKNKNYNLRDVDRILGRNINNFSDPIEASLVIRRALNQFLRKQHRQLCLQDSHIIMKKQYLLTMKIFCLRCSHHELINRNKTH